MKWDYTDFEALQLDRSSKCDATIGFKVNKTANNLSCSLILSTFLSKFSSVVDFVKHTTPTLNDTKIVI